MITVRLLLVDAETKDAEPDNERPIEDGAAELLNMLGEPDEEEPATGPQDEEEEDDDGASSASSAWSGDLAEAQRSVSRWKVASDTPT